ncbi:alpha-lactalbumin isoform X1 [Xyrichtys novacula]|uniref:Lactose synthase B protein n=1 Tax=Xyrichtys novacula TaxID=13765 RepID=A0AAV1EVJ2_XYRNO|nr:alpha-lactalbumin isoform X1 [Xyrichtys novacula]
MKLGLLLAVVVAVLVSSLSEGRVVSKCELRRKLSEQMHLPKWFNPVLKDRLLAAVICELNRTSSLTTDMVDVWGDEETTTTTITPNPSTSWVDEMEEEPTASFEEPSSDEMTSEEIPEEETTTEEISQEETTPEEIPEEETAPEEIPEEETTSEEIPEEETTTAAIPEEETTTTAIPEEETTTTAIPEEETTTTAIPEEFPEEETTTEKTEVTTPAPSTPETTQTPQAAKRRRKREIEVFNDEYIWTPMEFKLEERVNRLESECNEEEIEMAESGMDIVDSDSSQDQLLSLRKHGIFQLSDGYFCDSGHRHSQNKCKSKCSDFTDDDISNDIDCFVKIGCWKDKLMTEIGPLMNKRGKHGGLSVDSVANFVYHVELSSGFDTSAVNRWGKNPSDVTSAQKRAKEQSEPTECAPPPPPPSSPQHPERVWKLYGLFQLSNHLVCRDDDDDTDLSETICKINCKQLVDDDISDDIECLWKIIEPLFKEGYWNLKPDLRPLIMLIFQPRCGDVTASEYFSDCPSLKSV